MDATPAVRLGAADAAWWRMEEPVNQMTITAVLTFAARIEFARVRELLRARLLPVEPFRRRLGRPRLGIGALRWVADEGFDLDRHVHRVTLPGAAGERELQEFVSRLMSRPLDPRLPLWHFHFVENLAGGCALVARIHHCVADGVALIHLLLTLDDTPGNEGPAHTWAVNGAAPPPARALRPGTAAAAARAFARLMLLRPDRGPLRGRLGVRKTAAWSAPFPLAELRACSRALGCTINDLLVAAAAGALRAHLGADARRVRAVVPVNLRRTEEAGLMGNRFGLVFVALPVGIAHPMDRLFHVRREMTRLKASCEAGVTYGLLRVLGPLGRLPVRLAVRFLGWKASLVFTDVPGPRETVWFAGAPLTGVMAWVPQSGRLSLGISVLSYAGQVRVGIAADSGLLPNPGALVEAYQAEVAALLASARREGADALGPAPVAAAAPEPVPQEARG